MATLVLDAYSRGYPLITNRIRASVYLQSDPQALIDQIIDSAPGHPARLWHFPGLPRTNYAFVLEEIDGADVVVANLATFDVVPGIVGGSLVRDDEQIQVDTTPGFVSGTNTFTFDGTAGKPDYIGWNIVPSELTGRGILVRGLDYSWDTLTGTLVMLQTGDEFQPDNYWNIHFDSQENPAGNSAPTIFDQEIIYKEVDYALIPDDFGKKLIINPSSFMQIDLPAINTIPQGRRLFVEMNFNGSSFLCARFNPNGSDVINFAKGRLYIMSGECFSIYRFRNPNTLANEWRVCEYSGNFLTKGQFVSEYNGGTDVYNKVLCNGQIGTVEQFARLYFDYINETSNICNYDDWAVGNNKYKFSYANSANPANAGKFHFPDLRGMFERASYPAVSVPDFKANQNKLHNHKNGIADDATTLFVYGAVTNDMPGAATRSIVSENLPRIYQGITSAEGASESCPDHIVVNKYVLV